MPFHRIPIAVGAAFLVAVSFFVAVTVSDASPASAPQAGSLTFTAAGDFGGTANTDAVLQGIAASGAGFHLTLGDLSYGTYAPETAWCDYIKGKVGATFPFELVSGNHDMDGQPTGHINNFATCLPDRIGGLTGTYGKEYYFDSSGLARIIFISPNLTLDGSTYAYTVGNAHYTWLVNAIDGARAANLPWVIVAMHKNCITTGVKSCEIGTDLFNLLIAKKVDLVLQGHDHNYQRSKQIAFNGTTCTSILPGDYTSACIVDDGADNAYVKGAGMMLTIVGTGGQSLYGSNPADAEAGYFSKIVLPGDTARYGFLQVTVSATQLSAQFMPVTAGTFTDAYTITEGAPPPTAVPSPTPQTTTLIAKNSTWKYLDNGSDQGTAWRANGFNDSGWASGSAQLGYGDGDESTVVGYGPDGNNKYVTTYFRKTFTVASPGAFSSLTLKILRDDGAIVYLNGTQVASTNMPAPFAYNTYATTAIGGADEATYYSFTLSASNLQHVNGHAGALNGTNVLAVEVHQANATSSDTSFDLELAATNMPTATTLSAFGARALDRARVRVNWLTANEINVLGFNVWRRRGVKGAWEKINEALVPSKNLGQLVGASYRRVDKKVIAGKTYFYKLEIIHGDQTGDWSEIKKVKVP